MRTHVGASSKQFMYTPSSKIFVLLGCTATFAITPNLNADSADSLQPENQATPNATAVQASDSSGETVFVLSPFEVSAEKTRGYIASESTTGTRVAMKLRDNPMVVDVVSAEFLNDFGAFDMSQQLGWVANVSPSDSEGSFVLRGFTSTPYVDGFRRLGPLDLVDTARIEIIKGPGASIYGQCLPGGVVNYTSRRPQAKPLNSLGVAVGNENLFRVEASSTGPVGDSKKLLYMVNLASSTRGFEQQWAAQQRKNLSIQFTYKPDTDTTFNVKFSGQRNRNNDRQSLPWVKTSAKGFLTNNNGQLGINADGTALKYTYPSIATYNAATDTYTTKITTANLPLPAALVKYNVSQSDLAKYNDYISNPSTWGTPLALSSPLVTNSSWDRLATEYPTLHTNGPSSYSENKLWSGNFYGERHWSEMLNTKFTFDVFNRPGESQSVSGNQMYFTDPNFPDGNVGASTPTFRQQYSKGYSSQLDNLFSFNTGPVAHKLLITFDFTHKADRDLRRTTDTSSNSTYVINDPSGLVYPLTLPLGPRSTGALRWNSSTASYVPGQQLLEWPYAGYSYWYPTYDKYPQLYQKFTTSAQGLSDDYGLFMSERATFFKGRLIAMAGGRYDYMQNWYKNYLSSDPLKIRSMWDEQALTYQMGLTGYVTKNVVLFANKSTAYNPNMQTVPRRRTQILGYDANGDPINGATTFETVVMPNETGKGYEFGTRFNGFNERLNLTLSRFVVDRENKVDSYTNEYGLSEYVGSGAQRSKGYEVSLNWAVTDSFQVNAGYGYNDTRYTKNSLAYLVGSPTPQNAKNNYSLVVRYDFRTGSLRGLRLIAGARYYDKSLISVGSGGFTTTNPYATSGFSALIRNTPLAGGVLPLPDLPAGIVVLSRNNPTTGAEPTGMTNPSTGAPLTNRQVNKGYVEGVNIPASWVKYTGQSMAADTTYYILDGDGRTSDSYAYKTNVDDNRSNVYNQPYALFNFGVTYTFKQGKQLSHSVRLNVQNAFDRFYTYGGGVLGYGREYTLAYTLSY